jgi:uncharacterized membrane protein
MAQLLLSEVTGRSARTDALTVHHLESNVMSNTSKVVGSALAGLLALNATSLAFAEEEPEKCYGIVKAGQNDCQTSSHACSGQSTQNRDPESWIYLPAGTCEKIAGGSLEPKKS